METGYFYFAIRIFFGCSIILCHSVHSSDVSKQLANIQNIVRGIEGKMDMIADLTRKVNEMERNVNSLTAILDDLNRKSLLLREIHQDNDGRKELLLRISRTVDEINRKHLALSGRKQKSETERLDKLSENVQTLFEVFTRISRKFDDFQERVDRISVNCLLTDFKLLITRKLDALMATTTILNDCFECGKDKRLKDIFQPVLRHSLDNVARKLQLCTGNDMGRSVHRFLEPKLVATMESLKNDININFLKFNGQLEEMKQECKISEGDVPSKYIKLNPASSATIAGDMAYEPQQTRGKHKGGDSGTPRETPGRIFRKLWRKMTEPINKIGDKIESLGQKIEMSNQKHHNQTISRIMDMKIKPGTSEACIKQFELLEDAIKGTASKLSHIEARQITVQDMSSKILQELEKGSSESREDDEDNGISISQSSKAGGLDTFNASSRGGHILATNCAELQGQGLIKSGVYTIKAKNSPEEFHIFCDMETEGGGWAVIQRRGEFGDTHQNFTQGWEMYKKGFGDLQKEFWLGNEKMHLLSSQEDVKLRVELEDFEGNTAHAEYSSFKVEDESHQYRLSVGDYKGNATDSLSLHNGKLFSTEDRDNDEVSSCCNCADTFKGGWWYYRCFEANLNGPYHTIPTENGYFLGIIWERWRGDYSLKASEMKLRPLTFEEPQDP